MESANENTRPDALPDGENTRRRLLRGALGAAPVLMTLASKPVLGAVACQNASAMTSAGSGVRVTATCSGMSPGYWASAPQNWPKPYVAASSPQTRVAGLDGSVRVTPATLFHSATTGFGGTYFGGKPLSEVLQMPDGGTVGLGKYCAAAILNAAAGRTPVLNEATVRAMWNNYVGQGYYEPLPGLRWRADDIARFIRSTIG